MNEISPRRALELALRLWWLVAAAAFLGGLGGWIFSLFHAPVYEATAFYNVSVDKAEVLRRLGMDPGASLEFSLVDPFLSPAADVFYLPEIEQALASAAQAEGMAIRLTGFNDRDFVLDRRGSLWYVTVRDRDPQRAARLANLWLEIADSHLRGLLSHAFTAEALQAERTSVMRCFSSLGFAEANACAGTAFSTPTDFEASILELDGRIAVEKQASRDIDTVLQISPDRPAEAPSMPVLYSKALLIVTGSLAGLLLGLVTAQSPVLRRRLAVPE